MKKCTIPGCDNKHNARGYCRKHYIAMRHSGQLDVVQQKGLPIKERLFLRSKAIEKTGCIEWTGSKDRDGYGFIGVNGSLTGTHRASWEEANGRPVPNGMYVLHKCDNPSCINPEHLFVGTQRDNVKDMVDKSRISSRKGALNGAAKITEDLVKAIRSDLRPSKQIANEYGLNRNTVWLIRSGRNWSHVS